MLQTISSVVQQSSSPPRGTPCSHKRGQWRPGHIGINVSLEMEEMPSRNVPGQRLYLPFSGIVTHLREILYIGKSHKTKQNGLFLYLRITKRRYLQLRVLRWLVNNQLERIRKEAVVTWFELQECAGCGERDCVERPSGATNWVFYIKQIDILLLTNFKISS